MTCSCKCLINDSLLVFFLSSDSLTDYGAIVTLYVHPAQFQELSWLQLALDASEWI